MQSQSKKPKGIVTQHIDTWDGSAFLLPCDVDQYCNKDNSLLLVQIHTIHCTQHQEDLLRHFRFVRPSLVQHAFTVHSVLFYPEFSKREKGWETCKNRMDQCALHGYDVAFRHVYKASGHLPASERVAKCQRQLCWNRFAR